MTRGMKRLLIVVLATILIRTIFPVVLNSYFSSERVIPSISNVSYNKQTDFILITCEVTSAKQVQSAEVHFEGEVIEMKCTQLVSGQADHVRFSATIPLVDDNVEVKIVAYNTIGDKSTHIIEK